MIEDYQMCRYCTGFTAKYLLDGKTYGFCAYHALGDTFQVDEVLVHQHLECPDLECFDINDLGKWSLEMDTQDVPSDETYGIKAGVDFPATLCR